MSTDLVFDEKTARALAKTGPKMKVIGPARAYKVDAPFRFGEECEAGDYLVLFHNGVVEAVSAAFVDKNFEPVPKRTRKPKEIE